MSSRTSFEEPAHRIAREIVELLPYRLRAEIYELLYARLLNGLNTAYADRLLDAVQNAHDAHGVGTGDALTLFRALEGRAALSDDAKAVLKDIIDEL